MYSDIAIRAHQLSKDYFLYERPQDRLKQFLWRGRKKFFHDVHALRNVSFEVKRGEALGIIGANGSGKSTLLQIICGTLTPSAGTVEARGRISALLELGTGFNPNFTGRENVFLNGAILGLSHAEIEEKFEDIAEFAGIGKFIEHPVSTYSSGMVVRLAFSVAVATNPDILVVDEALAVGDEAFQRKCYAHIASLKERGCTLLFVSHSARTIIELCDRALVMDGGELILDTAPKTAVALYQKLLYAPRGQRAAIRAAIRALPAGATADAADSLLSMESTVAAPQKFSLAPESTIYFASRGAVISRPQLTSLDNAPARQLERRARYIFSYEVEFNTTAFDVHFGMMIRTPTGITVAGENSASQALIPEIEAGTRMRVQFTFTCLLVPGTYYVNCGCVGALGEGEKRGYLHRILDAHSFQVLPARGFTSGGIADLYIEPTLIPLEKNTARSAMLEAPFIIGGTGGSGTRVVHELLEKAGIFMGDNNSIARDSRDFGPFLHEKIPQVLTHTNRLDYRLADLPVTVAHEISQKLSDVAMRFASTLSSDIMWGWKDPRSIYMLPFLLKQYPNMRFLHVVRDGRDMAVSTNLNQMKRYYTQIFSRPISDPPAYSAIELWNKVNTEAYRWGKQHLGERYYALRFEDVCNAPEKTLPLLLQWLGISSEEVDIQVLIGSINPPESMGRWQRLDVYTRAQLEKIASEGLKLFDYL